MDNRLSVRKEWKRTNGKRYDTMSDCYKPVFAPTENPCRKSMHIQTSSSSSSSSSDDESDSSSSSSSSYEYEWREAKPVEPPKEPSPVTVEVGSAHLPGIKREYYTIVPLKCVLVILFPNNTPEEVEKGIDLLRMETITAYEAIMLTEFLGKLFENGIRTFTAGGEIFVSEFTHGDRACRLTSLKRNYEAILERLFRPRNKSGSNGSSDSDGFDKKKISQLFKQQSSGNSCTSLPMKKDFRLYSALNQQRQVERRKIKSKDDTSQREEKQTKEDGNEDQFANVDVSKSFKRLNMDEKSEKSSCLFPSAKSVVANKSDPETKNQLLLMKKSQENPPAPCNVVVLHHLYKDTEEEEDEEPIVKEKGRSKPKKEKESNRLQNESHKNEKCKSTPHQKENCEPSAQISSNFPQNISQAAENTIDAWSSLLYSQLTSSDKSDSTDVDMKNTPEVEVCFLSPTEEVDENNNVARSRFELESAEECPSSDLSNSELYASTATEQDTANKNIVLHKEPENSLGLIKIFSSEDENHAEIANREINSQSPVYQTIHEEYSALLDKELAEESKKSTFEAPSVVSEPSVQSVSVSGVSHCEVKLSLSNETSSSKSNNKSENTTKSKSDTLKTAKSFNADSQVSGRSRRPSVVHPSATATERKKQNKIVQKSQKCLQSRMERTKEKNRSENRERNSKRSSRERRDSPREIKENQQKIKSSDVKSSSKRSRSPSSRSRDSSKRDDDERRSGRSQSPMSTDSRGRNQGHRSKRESSSPEHCKHGSGERYVYLTQNTTSWTYRRQDRTYLFCPDYSKLRFDLDEDMYSSLSSSEADFGDEEETEDIESPKRRVFHTKSSLDDTRQRSINLSYVGESPQKDDIRVGERETRNDTVSGSFRRKARLWRGVRDSNPNVSVEEFERFYFPNESSDSSLHVQTMESVIPATTNDIEQLVVSIRRDCEKSRVDESRFRHNNWDRGYRRERRSRSPRMRSRGRRRSHSPSVARSFSPQFHSQISKHLPRRRSLSPMLRPEIFNYDSMNKQDHLGIANFGLPTYMQQEMVPLANDNYLEPCNGEIHPSLRMIVNRDALNNPMNTYNFETHHADHAHNSRFVALERIWPDIDKGSNRPVSHNSNASMTEHSRTAFVSECAKDNINTTQAMQFVYSTHAFRPVSQGNLNRNVPFFNRSAFEAQNAAVNIRRNEPGSSWNNSAVAEQVNNDDQMVIILKDTRDVKKSTPDNPWPFHSSSSSYESSNEDSCDDEVESLMFSRLSGLLKSKKQPDTAIVSQRKPTNVSAKLVCEPGTSGRQEKDSNVVKQPNDCMLNAQQPRDLQKQEVNAQSTSDCFGYKENIAVTSVQHSIVPTVSNEQITKAPELTTGVQPENHAELGPCLTSSKTDASFPGSIDGGNAPTAKTNEGDKTGLENNHNIFENPSSSAGTTIHVATTSETKSGPDDVGAERGEDATSSVTETSLPACIGSSTNSVTQTVTPRISAASDAKSWKKMLLRKAQNDDTEKEQEALLDSRKTVSDALTSPNEITISPLTDSASSPSTVLVPGKAMDVSPEPYGAKRNEGSRTSEAKSAEVSNKKGTSETPESPKRVDDNDDAAKRCKEMENMPHIPSAAVTKELPAVTKELPTTSKTVPEASKTALTQVSKSEDANVKISNSAPPSVVKIATPSVITGKIFNQTRAKSSERFPFLEKFSATITVSVNPSAAAKQPTSRAPSLASRNNFRGPQVKVRKPAQNSNAGQHIEPNSDTGSNAQPIITNSSLAVSTKLQVFSSVTSTVSSSRLSVSKSKSSIKTTMTTTTIRAPISSTSVIKPQVLTSTPPLSSEQSRPTYSVPPIASQRDPRMRSRDDIIQDAHSNFDDFDLDTVDEPSGVRNAVKLSQYSESPLVTVVATTNSSSAVNASSSINGSNTSVITESSNNSTTYVFNSQAKPRKSILRKPPAPTSSDTVQTTNVPATTATVSTDLVSSPLSFSPVPNLSKSSETYCELAEAISSISQTTKSQSKRKRRNSLQKSESKSRKTSQDKSGKPRGRPPKRPGTKGKGKRRKRLPSISSDEDILEELHASAAADTKEGHANVVPEENPFSDSEDEDSDDVLISFMHLPTDSEKDETNNTATSEETKDLEVKEELCESPKDGQSSSSDDDVPLQSLKATLKANSCEDDDDSKLYTVDSTQFEMTDIPEGECIPSVKNAWMFPRVDATPFNTSLNSKENYLKEDAGKGEIIQDQKANEGSNVVDAYSAVMSEKEDNMDVNEPLPLLKEMRKPEDDAKDDEPSSKYLKLENSENEPTSFKASKGPIKPKKSKNKKEKGRKKSSKNSMRIENNEQEVKEPSLTQRGPNTASDSNLIKMDSARINTRTHSSLKRENSANENIFTKLTKEIEEEDAKMNSDVSVAVNLTSQTQSCVTQDLLGGLGGSPKHGTNSASTLQVQENAQSGKHSTFHTEQTSNAHFSFDELSSQQQPDYLLTRSKHIEFNKATGSAGNTTVIQNTHPSLPTPVTPQNTRQPSLPTPVPAVRSVPTSSLSQNTVQPILPTPPSSPSPSENDKGPSYTLPGTTGGSTFSTTTPNPSTRNLVPYSSNSVSVIGGSDVVSSPKTVQQKQASLSDELVVPTIPNATAPPTVTIIWRMPEGDSCHGFLEVCMSSPGPLVYSLRRIPYIKITTNPSGGSAVPDRRSMSYETTPNMLNNHPNLPTSSACATYLRLRDVISLLKTSPEALLSLTQRCDLKLCCPNAFAQKLFKTVYDPVTFSDPAMHKLTMRNKQGEQLQLFLDKMIILDEFLHSLLPKFYLEALTIPSFDVPKFVNVKIFKPIVNIDDEVIKVFRKPYEYNVILQSKDDKVKCRALKRKKFVMSEDEKRQKSKSTGKGGRRKKKSVEEPPNSLPEPTPSLASSKHPIYMPEFRPAGLPMPAQGSMVSGTNFSSIYSCPNVVRSANQVSPMVYSPLHNDNFNFVPPAGMTQVRGHTFPVTSNPALPWQQSGVGTIGTAPAIYNQPQMSSPPAYPNSRPSVIQRTELGRTPPTMGVPRYMHYSGTSSAPNLPTVSSVLMRTYGNRAPNMAASPSTNASVISKVPSSSFSSATTGPTVSHPAPPRDVVAEAFASEVGFTITSVFSLQTQVGSQNVDNADQYSDITENSSDNDNVVPDNTSASLLTTKEFLKNASRVLSKQNRNETEGNNIDCYDMRSQSHDVSLKGVTVHPKKRAKLLKQFLPKTGTADDSCHLSGVVSKLKSRVEGKKKPGPVPKKKTKKSVKT